MTSLLPSLPIALPGIAAAAAGSTAFVTAVIVARLRNRSIATQAARRARRSWLGIGAQGAGFAIVLARPGPITVDPLSVAALATAAIVAVLMIAAVALFAWSTRVLGKQWSLTARTRDDHRLITDGPFAHVRHPIYAAMLIQLVALAIALGTEWRLIVALPLVAAGTAIRVGDEERLLREAFGTDFDAYAARVPRLLPHLRRRRPF